MLRSVQAGTSDIVYPTANSHDPQIWATPRRAIRDFNFSVSQAEERILPATRFKTSGRGGRSSIPIFDFKIIRQSAAPRFPQTKRVVGK